MQELSLFGLRLFRFVQLLSSLLSFMDTVIMTIMVGSLTDCIAYI